MAPRGPTASARNNVNGEKKRRRRAATARPRPKTTRTTRLEAMLRAAPKAKGRKEVTPKAALAKARAAEVARRAAKAATRTRRT